MPSRRRDWTIAEWRHFTARCRGVREQISALIRAFPETPGVRTKDVNQLVRAHNRLALAFIALEGIIERQHDELYGHVVKFVHGDSVSCWAPCRGRVKASSPPLTREQWAELGGRLKILRADTGRLGMELQGTRGANKRIVDLLSEVGDLPALRCRLDELVCHQHPDWPEASRVFYGDALQQVG